MKKNIYLTILIIVTAVCMAAGIVYRVGYGRTWRVLPDTYENKGKRIEIRDSEEGDWQSVSVEMNASRESGIDEDAITTVIINMDLGDITIRNGSELGITYDGRESYKPEVRRNGSTLQIIQPSIHEMFRLGSVHSEITLTLPEETTLSSLEINESLGDVSVRSLSSREMVINNQLGDISLENCEVETLSIDSDLGDVDVEACLFTYLEVHQSMGDVEISSKRDLSDASLRLETDMGEVSINGEEQGRKHSHDGNGKATVIVDNNMGDIDLEY